MAFPVFQHDFTLSTSSDSSPAQLHNQSNTEDDKKAVQNKAQRLTVFLLETLSKNSIKQLLSGTNWDKQEKNGLFFFLCRLRQDRPPRQIFNRGLLLSEQAPESINIQLRMCFY